MRGEADTRFARTPDGLHIAYQAEGDGPLDVVQITDGTLFSIDSSTEQPAWRAYIDALASFSRLIRFDLRGIGLSDSPGPNATTVEAWVRDALAVLDAEGVDRPAVLATGFGGLAAMLLAASHPDRTRALILVNASASYARRPDYPIGFPLDRFEQYSRSLVDPSDRSNDDLTLMAPALAPSPGFRDWWQRAGHRGASPATALAFWNVCSVTDLRSVLRSIHLPTLVVHARDNQFVRASHGRFLADNIAGARFVELPFADHVAWALGAELTGEVEEFLTGTRRPAVPDRLLATILLTDIVGSTSHASTLGDEAWRRRLDQYDDVVKRQLDRYGGRHIKSTGDGTLAVFDAPARTIACARAINAEVLDLGLSLRAGIHTGEVELRGPDVSGIAVHIAHRICERAEAGQILVSRTVVDLVVGSGTNFHDMGEHELRGVSGGAWRTFAVRP